jgi:dihydroneopterin aldolase
LWGKSKSNQAEDRPHDHLVFTFQQISLHIIDMSFRESHGLYEIENKTKQDFLVSTWIRYSFDPDHPEEYIDYVAVYADVRAQMKIPEGLMENLVIRIQEYLSDRYPMIEYCKVCIRKSPVLHGPYGSLDICYEGLGGLK